MYGQFKMTGKQTHMQMIVVHGAIEEIEVFMCLSLVFLQTEK